MPAADVIRPSESGHRKRFCLGAAGDSDCGRGNVIGASCMARTNAGALLVCDCYTDHDAVNSARDVDVIARTHRRERAGRVCRGNRSNLLRPKPCRIRADGLSAWTDVVRLSTGQAGLSVCKCHVGDCRTHPTRGAGVLVAVHRFIEVSLGILVALAVAAIWREEDSTITS